MNARSCAACVQHDTIASDVPVLLRARTQRLFRPPPPLHDYTTPTLGGIFGGPSTSQTDHPSPLKYLDLFRADIFLMCTKYYLYLLLPGGSRISFMI